jgi:hypothetical protein
VKELLNLLFTDYMLQFQQVVKNVVSSWIVYFKLCNTRKEPDV